MIAIQALALAAAGSAAPPLAEAPTPERFGLRFKAFREWNILLPDERSEVIGDTIPFPHIEGGGFAAELRGTSLWLDRDGDGTLDVEVEAAEERGQSALVLLRGEGAGGEDLRYAVRVSSDGRWSWASSCAMVGEVHGTKFSLIDQNGNGRYDDFGADAMIVGRGEVASFLSRVVNLDGELFELGVQSDGTQVELTPYQGDSGTLDLVSGFESEALLRSVVVQSADGELSFELSRAEEGLLVPAGEYALHSGQLVLGKGVATLSGGRMAAFELGAESTLAPTWGGPVEAEVVAQRQGGQVVFIPSEIFYYGDAGEQYSDFMPLGSSPEFALKDANTGDVLVNATFPGNC